MTGAASSADPGYAALDPPDLNARNSDNDFERVAPQVVSAGLSCGDYVNHGHRLAADQAANLYAVMSCQRSGDAVREPTGFVAVSLDGGRTFGTPVDTGLPAYSVAVAGAGPGVAVVAAVGPTGVGVVRTEDAGVNWQPPVVLHAEADPIHLLAATGQRMLLSVDTDNGPAWWLSEDGGRTFHRSPLASSAYTSFSALGLDPDGTIWVVSRDYRERRFLRTSRDDGKTFEAGFRIPVVRLFSGFVASPNLLFTVSDELVLFSRDGSGSTRSVPGLPAPTVGSFDPVLLADEADNLVVLSTVHNGSYTAVEARRLPSGETQLTPPKSLGLSNRPPSAVALSENATAVLLIQSGQVSVAVETWP
jgi:hypothetical protein